jgi:hypothetical protein
MVALVAHCLQQRAHTLGHMFLRRPSPEASENSGKDSGVLQSAGRYEQLYGPTPAWLVEQECCMRL